MHMQGLVSAVSDSAQRGCPSIPHQDQHLSTCTQCSSIPWFTEDGSWHWNQVYLWPLLHTKKNYKIFPVLPCFMLLLHCTKRDNYVPGSLDPLHEIRRHHFKYKNFPKATDRTEKSSDVHQLLKLDISCILFKVWKELQAVKQSNLKIILCFSSFDINMVQLLCSS